MEKNSKIYIAGHAGLVGSTIKDKLILNNYNNLILRTSSELDLRNQQEVNKFFEVEKPDYVFLAAAKVGGILANITYKAEFIYDNLIIAANIINSSYNHGVRKLLNLGSSCIYPKFTAQPIKEDSLLTGSLELTNEPYAIAKIAAVKLCRYHNEQYGTNFLSVMPNNMYGPGDNFNLETGHAMGMLIRKFHLAKLLKEKDVEGIKADISCYPLGFGLDEKIDFSNEQSMVSALAELGIMDSGIKLWGSGKPLREFLFVEDFAEASVFLMENYSYSDTGEIVNIGSGEEISLKDLSSLMGDIVKYAGDISWDTSKPDGTPRKSLDISKIESLGWKPKILMKQGIETTYNWYLDSIKAKNITKI